MERRPIILALTALVLVVLVVAGVVVYEVVFKGVPEGAGYAATVTKTERSRDGTVTVHVKLVRTNSGTFSKVTLTNIRVYQKVDEGEKMAKEWQGTATLDKAPPDTPAPEPLTLTFTGGPYPDEWKEFSPLSGVDYTVKSGLLGMLGQVHEFGEEHQVDVKVPRH